MTEVTDAQREQQAFLGGLISVLLARKLFDPKKHTSFDQILSDVIEGSDMWNQALAVAHVLQKTDFKQKTLAFSTSYVTPAVEALKSAGHSEFVVDGQLHMTADGDVIVRYPPTPNKSYESYSIHYPAQPNGLTAHYVESADEIASTSVGTIFLDVTLPKFEADTDPNNKGPSVITDYDADDNEIEISGRYNLSRNEEHELEVVRIGGNRPTRILSSYHMVEYAPNTLVVKNPASSTYSFLSSNTKFTEHELAAWLEKYQDYKRSRDLKDYVTLPEDDIWVKNARMTFTPDFKPAGPLLNLIK